MDTAPSTASSCPQQWCLSHAGVSVRYKTQGVKIEPQVMDGCNNRRAIRKRHAGAIGTITDYRSSARASRMTAGAMI